MSCSNSKLIRFVLGVGMGCGNTADPLVGSFIASLPAGGGPGGYQAAVGGITKIGGISLGEEGEVEIPDWDVVGLVSDGKRKLTTLTLQARAKTSLKNNQASLDDGLSVLTEFYKARHAVAANFYVFITDRSWNVLWYYLFENCTLKSFKQEDQELGTPKLGFVDIDAAPENVYLYDCSGNEIVAPASASSAFPNLTCPV